MKTKIFCRILDVMIIITIAVIMSMYFSSCSTIKKTVKKSSRESVQVIKKKSDSTAKKITDSTQVKKAGIKFQQHTDGSYSKVTEDVEIDWIQHVIPIDSTQPIKVKERRRTTWENGVISVSTNDVTWTKDSTSVQRIDTGSVKKESTEVIQDKSTDHIKDKKVIRIPLWWLLLLLLIPLYKYRKKIFAFISVNPFR